MYVFCPVALKIPDGTDKCVCCSRGVESTPFVEGTAKNAAECHTVNKDHSGAGVLICRKKQLLSN